MIEGKLYESFRKSGVGIALPILETARDTFPKGDDLEEIRFWFVTNFGKRSDERCWV